MIRLLKKIKRMIFFHIFNLFKVTIFSTLPFLKFFIRQKIDFVSINVTDRCCLKCIMCNEWKEDKKDLSTEQWEDIIRQSKLLGVKTIFFSGGEPFLRKDIFDLINFTNSLNMDVSFITNAYLINEEKIQKLKTFKINSVTISIDAIEEKFDYIRGVKGAFDKVINSCELLAKLSTETNIKIFVNFLLMKHTLDDFYDVKAICEKYKFPIIICLLDYSPVFFNVTEKARGALFSI